MLWVEEQVGKSRNEGCVLFLGGYPLIFRVWIYVFGALAFDWTKCDL